MSKKFNLKRRFTSIIMAFITLFMIFPVTTAHAATYDGRQAYANVKLNVYDKVNGSIYGSIYKNEGFTILNYLSNSWIKVEYSTSSGAKRGYVKKTSSNIEEEPATYVATMTKDTNLYYGDNTSKFQKSGEVYKGEVITVLGRSYSGWAFIEYNTNSGRKRGYMNEYSSKISGDSRGILIAGIPIERVGSFKSKSGSYNVYSGPTKEYPVIGKISNEKIARYDLSSSVSYIQYHVTGSSKDKSGYIFL